MTLQTLLQFGDNASQLYNKSYLVADYKTFVARPYSAFMPHGKPVCDRIDITVNATGKDDLELYEWFFTNSYKSGRIILNIQDVTSKNYDEVQRALIFEDAQCFQLNETYSIGDHLRRLLTLSLSARCFTIDNIKFNRES